MVSLGVGRLVFGRRMTQGGTLEEDWREIGEGAGQLLDLCGAEFDLGVGHLEGELVDAGFDGVPTRMVVISG